MKLLFTNYNLSIPGGSELFTWDIAKELAKNNGVIIYSPFCGDVAEKIRKSGLTVIDNLTKIRNEKIDIIHAHHNITAIQARYFFPNVPMVFLSHGIIPFLESPPSIDLGIQSYLAVSEEVKTYLIKKTIPAEKIRIFRNFADTEKFKPVKPINEKLKKVLVIMNNFDKETYNIIKSACKKLNIGMELIGKTIKCVWNVEYHINNADLVIALGRSAIESMSCGRAVIVYGNSSGVIGGDGIITGENIDELKQNNFSGRRYKNIITKENLVNEFLKYNPKMGTNNRKMVQECFNIKDRIDELLKIYKDSLASPSPDKLFIPERELAYLIKTQHTEILVREIQQIISSKSWKITAPLRWIKQLFS